MFEFDDFRQDDNSDNMANRLIAGLHARLSDINGEMEGMEATVVTNEERITTLERERHEDRVVIMAVQRRFERTLRKQAKQIADLQKQIRDRD